MPPELIALLSGTSLLVVLGICASTVVTLAVTIGVTLLAIRIIRKNLGPDRSVLENGIPARARILGVRQTGITLNDQPQIAFQLEVHPPSGAPYQAETRAVIAIINIPQFQPGAEVPVKIHPTDPTKVVLDFQYR